MQTLRLQEATRQTLYQTLDACTTEWQAAPCTEVHGAQGGLEKGHMTGQARPAFTEWGLSVCTEAEGVGRHQLGSRHGKEGSTVHLAPP